MQSNEDHCSACRSLGALVYCDGCPRAFHWLCLDPPMEATDLPEGESRWFCPACVLEQVRCRISSSISSLISATVSDHHPNHQRLSNLWLRSSTSLQIRYPQSSNYLKTSVPFSKTASTPRPTSSLADSYRHTVGTGPRGTYQDMSEVKQARFK